MKKSLLLLATFGVSFLSFAKTTTYFQDQILRASIQSSEDAEKLYQSLDVEVIEGRSGFQKTFVTKDGLAAITCTKSKLGGPLPYRCSLSMEFNNPSNSTKVYADEQFGVASLLDDAKRLYNTLDIPEVNGRSSYGKSYRTGDSKAQIWCSRTKLPAPSVPFNCSLYIELP